MSTPGALCAVVLAALAPVGITACGGSDASSDAPAAAKTAAAAKAATTAAQPPSAHGPASVKLATSRKGRILVESGGRTLYLFTQDKPSRAVCTSDYLNCTRLWPPLMTTGRPQGQAGVKQRLLGSIQRTKPAGTQVTYNGHPLYLYADDEQAGDLKGQGMYDYWYVLSAGGHAITTK